MATKYDRLSSTAVSIKIVLFSRMQAWQSWRLLSVTDSEFCTSGSSGSVPLPWHQIQSHVSVQNTARHRRAYPVFPPITVMFANQLVQFFPTIHCAVKTYGVGMLTSHFLNFDTNWKWVISFTPWPSCARGKKSVSESMVYIFQWVSHLIWALGKMEKTYFSYE